MTEALNPGTMEDLNSGEALVDHKDTRNEKQELKNPLSEIDTEGEDGDSISPCATVVPSNTPVTGDSGHVSPTMESSLDSLSDGTQQQQDLSESCNVSDALETVADMVTTTVSGNEHQAAQSSNKDDAVFTNTASFLSNEDTNSSSSAKTKAMKESKKEEKKKNKKKEDKNGEHILRALNSLQSSEDKLAALCKKFADLHEEHRVLQTSFKTQQRALNVVVREKEQIQTEHTRAMMAKSKLESLCRELQKHNRTIEAESLKRAKESEEKRKEITAHFSSTIGEIQNQMTDNSEKNNILKKENENLAEQLRTFIAQCNTRDEHVKRLQEQHEVENKLAAAKLAQVEAIIKDVEDRSNKEKELLLIKITDMSNIAHLTETQLELYKSRYEEFQGLSSRSGEIFDKYKVETNKMMKRITILEKDGLQWKVKWEATNKALLEQYAAKSKSEQEAAVYGQKVKKLESLCRALQAELHNKKVVTDDKVGKSAQPMNPVRNSSPVQPESIKASSDESSKSVPGSTSSKKTANSADSPPAAFALSELSSCSTPALSNKPESTSMTNMKCTGQCSLKDSLCESGVSGTDVGFRNSEDVQTISDTTTPLSSLTAAAVVTPSEVTACDNCMPQPHES